MYAFGDLTTHDIRPMLPSWTDALVVCVAYAVDVHALLTLGLFPVPVRQLCVIIRLTSSSPQLLHLPRPPFTNTWSDRDAPVLEAEHNKLNAETGHLVFQRTPVMILCIIMRVWTSERFRKRLLVGCILIGELLVLSFEDTMLM